VFSPCSLTQLEYKALQEKLQSVREEASQSTDKYSELKRTLESERAAWFSDKKTLEDTIVDMSTSERHSESDQSLQTEARRQAERATVSISNGRSPCVMTNFVIIGY
jgi:nucleoprotein TPR